VIGITTYLVPASFGAWDVESALVPADYVRAVERAGGRPLLVPPSTDGVEETLDAVDGLIFSGGSDLDPGLYGQEPHPATYGVMPERDRAELTLLQAALERDMPVLAVCRGSQVLNVAAGGDLVQHLPDEVGHDRHKHTPGVSRCASVPSTSGRCWTMSPPRATFSTCEPRHTARTGMSRCSAAVSSASSARSRSGTVPRVSGCGSAPYASGSRSLPPEKMIPSSASSVSSTPSSTGGTSSGRPPARSTTWTYESGTTADGTDQLPHETCGSAYVVIPISGRISRARRTARARSR